MNDSLHCVVLYVLSHAVKHKAAPVRGVAKPPAEPVLVFGLHPGTRSRGHMHIFILDKGVRPVAKATNFTYVFLPGNSTLQSNEVS